MSKLVLFYAAKKVNSMLNIFFVSNLGQFHAQSAGQAAFGLGPLNNVDALTGCSGDIVSYSDL